MLSKHRCPHTGVINYFARSEPYFSIGSIMRSGDAEGGYCWRVYDARRTIAGIAADMKSAERNLRHEYEARKQLQ